MVFNLRFEMRYCIIEDMSEFYPKASEIVLNSAKNTESFCETFVYEPENIEEEKVERLSNDNKSLDLMKKLNHYLGNK